MHNANWCSIANVSISDIDGAYGPLMDFDQVETTEVQSFNSTRTNLRSVRGLLTARNTGITLNDVHISENKGNDKPNPSILHMVNANCSITQSSFRDSNATTAAALYSQSSQFSISYTEFR